jgi:hypothetical protein
MSVYVFVWGNNARRAELKGRRCVVEAHGRMSTVLVRFLDNGERVTTSRRALRQTTQRPDFNPRVDYPERYMRDGVWSI